MYDIIRDSASDEIPLPEELITNAEIEVSDTPVISNTPGTVIIEAPTAEESQVRHTVQIERIEKVASRAGTKVICGSPAHSQRQADHHARDQAGD